MGAPKKSDWREARRKRAWELHQQGWMQKTIAAALGVSQGAVSQWLKVGREGGIEALNAHPPIGRQSRLRAEQLNDLVTQLAKGAEAHGYQGNVWTTQRVVAVIARLYHVQYHRAHASRLLRKIGWTQQTPRVRASQRDDAAIEQWKQTTWPLIKKKRRSKTLQ